MTIQTLRRLLPVLLLPLAAASAPPAKPAAAGVRGDYVEARTASVFAGACHYNGERVTEGRSAVVAWSFTGGSVDGVDLAGTRVLAAVTSDENLADAGTARKTELTIDANTDAAAKAAAAWVKSACIAQLGDVVAVKRASVTFRHESDAYAVSSPGFAAMSVKPMPDADCCSQPHLVWYSPLMAVDGKKVGYTETASCAAGVATWERSNENSAIYGTFGK